MIRKTIRGDFGTYYVRVSINEEHQDYIVRIYDQKPDRKFFTTPDPIIREERDINTNLKELVIELIQKWEQPKRHKKEMDEWDGKVPKTEPKKNNPAELDPGHRDFDPVDSFVQPIKINDWQEKISEQRRTNPLRTFGQVD